LGYNVKDLSRLRVEMKCAVCSEGFKSTSITSYAFQAPDYTYFFGYYAPRGTKTIGTEQPHLPLRPLYEEYWSKNQEFSPESAGGFALRCRLPIATGYIYTTKGPSQVDG
jgi:hypothetical protein